MRDLRHLLSKIFLLGVYAAFFFVQLYLKYSVASLGSFVQVYQDTATSTNKASHLKNATGIRSLNILINKRFYPEQPLEIFIAGIYSSGDVWVDVASIGYKQSGTCSPSLYQKPKRGPPSSC